MSGIVDKLKDKMSSDKGSEDKNEFTIQPHPAKSNNPAENEFPQPGGGLNSSPEWQAHQAKGPYQPSDEIRQNMPAAAGRDELKARSAELNRD